MKELDFAFIGQRIKEIRTEKRLTQEYIAESADVNVSHISNIETGKTKVSLTLLVNICNALDTTLDYVLENEYKLSDTSISHELLHVIEALPKDKADMLLRIAKVL